MTILQRFGAYAADFEKTFEDDDWSRLEPYFTNDAVYEVKGVPFACRLAGPDAIFRGMKKSLDGFDRKLERRLELAKPPEVRDDTVEVVWKVHYGREGAPRYVLRGRSEARYEGDRIAHLVDIYEEDVARESGEWMRAHGPDLDPSYT